MEQLYNRRVWLILQAFCLLIFVSSHSIAQCIVNVTLTSQKQVNQFRLFHPFSDFFGTITISGNDITNIDSLYAVNSIGKLNIVNTGLSDLEGLVSLRKINGELVISGNDQLMSLRGLHNVKDIPGRVEITNNGSLKDLNGLALTSINGLIVSENPSLRNLLGLSSLNKLTGFVTIKSNPRIKNLKGLDNLEAIGGKLEIAANDSLRTLNGLQQLTSVGTTNEASLILNNNRQLKTLEALSSLGSVPGRIMIESNASLESLIGLESITSAGGISIKDNPILLNLNGLSSLMTINGEHESVIITNNTALVNYCGLYSVVKNNFKGTLSISGNGRPSSKHDIVVGGVCKGLEPAIALGSQVRQDPKKN